MAVALTAPTVSRHVHMPLPSKSAAQGVAATVGMKIKVDALQHSAFV